jgi:hypothetical protein
VVSLDDRTHEHADARRERQRLAVGEWRHLGIRQLKPLAAFEGLTDGIKPTALAMGKVSAALSVWSSASRNLEFAAFK